MKWVLKEMKVYKKSLLILIFTVLISALCSMALPVMMKEIIDEAIPSKEVMMIFRIGCKMLIFTAIYIFCGIITVRQSTSVAMGIGGRMRQAVFNQVQEFSSKEIDHFSISSLITRSNSDAIQVQTFLSQCLSIAVTAPLLCISGVIMALITSPKLSFSLVVTIPLLVLSVWLVGRKAIPLASVLQKKLDRINMVIREKLTGVRVIRAFGTTAFEEERFDAINRDYTITNAVLQNITALLRPVLVVILALAAAVVIFGAYYLKTAKGIPMTTGEVVAMIEYIMQIMASVVMLTVVFLLLPRAASAANRVQEVLNTPTGIQDPDHEAVKPVVKGHLTFKDVSFTYEGADKPAIAHLSFEAKPGETTAIIGGTGTGKSTIVNLIPRFYDVTEGQVLVDGIDVRDYTLKELRGKIGFVPQKAMLFKGTIDSNIAFGMDEPNEEAIESAVEIAQSTDFVLKKEGGFGAMVAQGGSNFSGGQKQRLCIARGIVSKPEIYIFDDSFSALDFKTDKSLRAALKKETGEATVIIVAQRVGTIMDADRIIVVENGEVAGIGKHHELVENCSVYREIVESQIGKEAE